MHKMFVSYYWTLELITNPSIREIVVQLVSKKECSIGDLTRIFGSQDVAASCIVFDQAYYWNSQSRQGGSHPLLHFGNSILKAARRELGSPQISTLISENNKVEAANWMSASNALAVFGNAKDLGLLVTLMRSSNLPDFRLECLNAIRFVVNRGTAVPQTLKELLISELDLSVPDKRILEAAVSILSLDQGNSDLLYKIAKMVRPVVSGRICQIFHAWGSEYADRIKAIANSWPNELASYEEDARFIREKYLPKFSSQ